MDFAALQTEFYARGFSYLNQDAARRTRAKRWLNEAYLEDICADYPWDFLLDSDSSTAPLTITDVDTILAVRDTTHDRELDVVDIAWLERTYGDLTRAGTAECLYATGDTTFTTYPLDTTSTIQVRYRQVPAELSGDTDEPIFKARWHPLIVDFAVIRAYIDSDNFEAMALLEQRAEKRLARMMNAELARSTYTGSILATDPWR